MIFFGQIILFNGLDIISIDQISFLFIFKNLISFISQFELLL